MSRNGSKDIAIYGAWETQQGVYVSVENWKPVTGKDTAKGDFGGNYKNHVRDDVDLTKGTGNEERTRKEIQGIYRK